MTGTPAPSGRLRSTAKFALWTAATLAGTALVSAAAVLVSGWLIDTVQRREGGLDRAEGRSQIGNYFGAASAVFSGLAFLILVVALLLQYQELRMQRTELADQREELTQSRQELHRSAEANMRSLHVQLTRMAMEDPSLAAVWNGFPGIPHEEERQYLFANLTFGHLLLARQWGSYSDDELRVHARSLRSSEPYRRYWALSRDAKFALPGDSHERKLAELIDEEIRTTPGPPAPPQ
ncbi:DUF6082 family protein [Streptomyces sp. TLI_146]|uniref:DUF6082 family protein n=1 Tax=Streptomyces sp. TLI_146 TaxID=1938858 RepID=UPI000C709AF8|nr:DUF6082 family protein [Streptomyces sp. TLI_146]PKV88434.1 hypothetical protein BX283_6051 [Streptomyces sp. TLI_146]